MCPQVGLWSPAFARSKRRCLTREGAPYNGFLYGQGMEKEEAIMDSSIGRDHHSIPDIFWSSLGLKGRYIWVSASLSLGHAIKVETNPFLISRAQDIRLAWHSPRLQSKTDAQCMFKGPNLCLACVPSSEFREKLAPTRPKKGSLSS